MAWQSSFRTNSADPALPLGRRPVTAFVLAGGGSFGVVQVGMLRALHEHGLRPDLVTGSSVGSINGAFYAGAPSAGAIETLAALWSRVRRRDVFPLNVSRVLGAALNRTSLVRPTGLRHLLETHLPSRMLEESTIPMHVVATDVRTGATVRLSSGAAVDAVLASCAIPAIYPPVRIGNQLLFDGAVASNTPIRVAVELGAKRIFVLPTRFACPLVGPAGGSYDVAFHAMDLIVIEQLRQDIERYSSQAEIMTVPPICPQAVAPYEFSRTGELIDVAARSTRQWLTSKGVCAGGASAEVSGVAWGACTACDAATRHAQCGANLPSCPS
jgi:NTE family protein